MTVLTDVPNSPRPTTRVRSGWDSHPALRWMRANLFSSITSTVTSVVLFAVLAKALIGARVGDTVKWRRPAGDSELEILQISYR